MRELKTLSLQKKMVEADTAIRTAIADGNAQVTIAERKNILEKEMTATEIARREAERDLIKAQADAQAVKMAGYAEADVMHAKGYNGKDILQAEVQKSYAENFGKMGGGNNVLGLSVEMAAGGALGSQVLNALNGTPFSNTGERFDCGQKEFSQKLLKYCSVCHAEVPENSRFCLNCGSQVDAFNEDETKCPKCKQTTKKGKFCMHCGALLRNTCSKCGAELPNNAKFCLECGEKVSNNAKSCLEGEENK